MQITGKLKTILPLESGTSKSGKEWQKQTVVIDTGDEFNNLTAISAFGDDKIKRLNKLEVGMSVAIMCNVYSREYKVLCFNIFSLLRKMVAVNIMIVFAFVFS